MIAIRLEKRDGHEGERVYLLLGDDGSVVAVVGFDVSCDISAIRCLRVLTDPGFDEQEQWVPGLVWYWREREYEADARAVVTGNGSRLIAYLEAQKEMFDRPRLVAAGRYKHPPVTRGR